MTPDTNKNILFSDSCRINCWGGVEKWVITMADSLHQKGYNTFLVCRKDSIIERKTKGLPVQTYNVNFYNSIDITSVWNIQKIIREQNIGLIICSTNLDIKLAGLAGKLAGIPVISRQGLALITDRIKYKILIKNYTTSVLTNTLSIKKQYESYKWFPENHIQVIYNGVAARTIDSGNVKVLRQQFISAPEEKLILSAGRLTTQKGFSYLIEAARIAQEQNRPWKFLIVGDGREKTVLESLIKKYQLKNIRLIGFRDNIQDYYACADIFVLSSITEGLPNVVLEAMIHKCPVIATNINGVCEVIENKKNGWIIPPRNSQAIFESINNCINDPVILKEMTQNAYQTVRDKFTVEKSTDHFIKYITHIITEYEKNHHKDA